MASTTNATSATVASSSSVSNNQSNSTEVAASSSNSSEAVAKAKPSSTSESTISQLKAATVVSPPSGVASPTPVPAAVAKSPPTKASLPIGTAVNAKQVRGGSAAAKPSSASGNKASTVKPVHGGIVPPGSGKPRGGAMPKPITPTTIGSAKGGSASAQRKAPSDRPVSATVAAQKGPNASASTNASAVTAKDGAKDGAKGKTQTTTPVAAASRDRPLTASHAGAKSNASVSRKEDTSQGDPAATLVAIGLPPTTSLEQVRQMFEKNWPLVNSRQVLPKGPKDPLGNQVFITFSQATDGVE